MDGPVGSAVQSCRLTGNLGKRERAMCLCSNFNNPNLFLDTNWYVWFHTKSTSCTGVVKRCFVAQTGQLAQNYTIEGCQSKKLTEIKPWSVALYDLLHYSSQPKKDPFQLKMASQNKNDIKEFTAIFSTYLPLITSEQH